MRNELNMMGLRVRELRLDSDKALAVKVDWTKKRKAEVEPTPVKKTKNIEHRRFQQQQHLCV